MMHKSGAFSAETSVAARVELSSQAGGQNFFMPKTLIPHEINDKLNGGGL